MYKQAIRPDELYHHGIKGQKWGIRRFQNKDGSRTADGKAQQRKERRKNIVKGVALAGAAAGIAGAGVATNRYGAYDRTIKNGKGKENSSPAEKITKEVSTAFDDTNKLVRSFGNAQRELERYKFQEEAKTMTDDELRKRINRINLEKQYADVNTREIQTGFDKAADILQIGGSIAGIAASAAIVATTLKGLKNG